MKLPIDSVLPEDIVLSLKKSLLDELQRAFALSKSTIETLDNYFIPVAYKKKQVILDYGERCTHCLLMVEGLVKSTFILDGIERIVWFMRKGEVVIAVHSWYDQQPSEEKLVAMENCICFALSFDQVKDLKLHHHDYALLALSLTEQYFNFSIQRTKWMQYTPQERLKDIHRMYPDLFLEIPSTDLAKFLGISRVTLNRIRKSL